MEISTTGHSIKGKTVLLTGASGFIGAHLSRRLLEEGADVHVFLRKKRDYSRLNDIIGDLTLWYGDITEYESVLMCIKNSRPNVIFHLAALRDVTRDISLVESTLEVNTKGTLHLLRGVLDAGIKLDAFINTGSSEEYGNGPVPFSEEQKEMPVSPYSASKVAATYYCQMTGRTAGLPVVTLRPFLTYGPYQDTDMFVPSLISHCIDGKDFPMTEGGQTREFNYIDDVIEAFILAACHKGLAGQIINVGNGAEYQIRDVAEKIVRQMGNPIRLLIGALPKREGEAGHFFCNNEKARRLLGWSPKVDLEEGLAKTIQWYKDISVKS